MPPGQVGELFVALAKQAIAEISEFQRRFYYLVRSTPGRQPGSPCMMWLLVTLRCFSPPYPNSFDYTDIYNVELWTLGYLDSQYANSTLRNATLSSHVQISRGFTSPPAGSPTLSDVLAKLKEKQHKLWDPMIPSMIGAYFSELHSVLDHLSQILNDGASAWIVVGDSRYAGVQVPVANVLEELIDGGSWELTVKEPFRSMRSSAQQGGSRTLAEHLLVTSKANIKRFGLTDHCFAITFRTLIQKPTPENHAICGGQIMDMRETSIVSSIGCSHVEA